MTSVMRNTRTRRMVEGALLVGMALVLSFIRGFQLPYGGAITLCSMLPIVLLSYRQGVKYGLFAGFIFGILQLIFNASAESFKGVSPLSLVGMLFFDFFVAYTALGLGGLFRNRFHNPSLALALGTIVALFCRFLGHFISGYLFFGQYAEWFFGQEGFTAGAAILKQFSGKGLYAIYSAVYNASYMLPEIVITTIAAVMIGTVPALALKQKQ